jgi:hypothetical protein
MKLKIGLIAISLSLIVVITLLFVLYEPAPTAPTSLTEAPVPTVKKLTWEQLLESLADKEGAEVRQHGIRFFQASDPDKAFLLFKKAAAKGDGWSAMVIGEMYDPATFAAKDFDQGRTAFSKPNPRKALQWYGQALQQGESKAQALYDTLITSIKKAAKEGDRSAERLLKRIEK